MNPFCSNDGHGLFALNKLYNFDMEIFGCQVGEEDMEPLGLMLVRRLPPEDSFSYSKVRSCEGREGRLIHIWDHISWSSFENSEIDGILKKLKLCYGCDLRYRFEAIYKD
jgi:hypothetical protein